MRDTIKEGDLNISSIKVGDVVKCDKGGREFYGLVDSVPDRGKNKQTEVEITPLQKGITYFHVTAREVTVVFRRLGRSNGSG